MKKKFISGKNWFFEDFLPGELPTSSWGFAIEKEIYSGKSKFQKIEVFETEEFGRILVLDGLVQLSTKDEFVYHEMLIHPAFLYHQKPERVLIIGGGDGGALREVAKYPVKEIFLDDIDAKVIEVSKKYLPSLSNGAFNNKRVKVFNEDGLKFVKKYNDFFDVIIIDLTDPTGISLLLWKIGFYKDVSRALKNKGVIGVQSGYIREPFAKKARKDIAKVFPYFKIHRAFVACYPFDEHTFSFGSKEINLDKISFKKIKEKYKKLKLKTKYYSPEIHFSSTVLPKSYR